MLTVELPAVVIQNDTSSRNNSIKQMPQNSNFCSGIIQVYVKERNVFRGYFLQYIGKRTLRYVYTLEPRKAVPNPVIQILSVFLVGMMGHFRRMYEQVV